MFRHIGIRPQIYYLLNVKIIMNDDLYYLEILLRIDNLIKIIQILLISKKLIYKYLNFKRKTKPL